MRKVIAQEWLSADGFAADAQGSTDFFGPAADHAQSDKDILKAMGGVDTILLGANTYKMFIDFWPTEQANGEIMADSVNNTDKLVFSNSLNGVQWGKWDNAVQQKGDAVDAVKKLKQQPGKDMVLWGSLSLFRTLLAAGLIDELEIRTVPVILGKGMRLFGDSDKVKLESKRSVMYDSGINMVDYKVLNQIV